MLKDFDELIRTNKTFLIALAASVPAGDKKGKSDCAQVCTFNYEPICAEPENGNGKPLSFGNECLGQKRLKDFPSDISKYLGNPTLDTIMIPHHHHRHHHNS
uniref:Kazal-like domain-containing protein n=1 Tax=Megaselia scalaris TaxID=36166 RepID=T1GS86_MEGSC